MISRNRIFNFYNIIFFCIINVIEVACSLVFKDKLDFRSLCIIPQIQCRSNLLDRRIHLLSALIQKSRIRDST